MIKKDKKETPKDPKTERAKLEQGIDQKGLEHIISHKEESQIIE